MSRVLSSAVRNEWFMSLAEVAQGCGDTHHGGGLCIWFSLDKDNHIVQIHFEVVKVAHPLVPLAVLAKKGITVIAPPRES